MCIYPCNHYLEAATLSKLLSLSESWLCLLYNNTKPCLLGLLWGLNEIMDIKHLVPSLVHSKCSINISFPYLSLVYGPIPVNIYTAISPHRYTSKFNFDYFWVIGFCCWGFFLRGVFIFSNFSRKIIFFHLFWSLFFQNNDFKIKMTCPWHTSILHI